MLPDIRRIDQTLLFGVHNITDLFLRTLENTQDFGFFLVTIKDLKFGIENSESYRIFLNKL